MVDEGGHVAFQRCKQVGVCRREGGQAGNDVVGRRVQGEHQQLRGELIARTGELRV